MTITTDNETILRHRPIRVAARSAMAYTVALVLPETI
jgi:hypothetical protein